ncbi:hypothetical protein NC652_000761 [Populus alba x Populus x berolinensis]|nr:hypothetical protein NC652_000761 [Populus alba x Populus x berolinensis]
MPVVADGDLAVRDEKPCYCSRLSHELLLIVGKNQLLIITKTPVLLMSWKEKDVCCSLVGMDSASRCL